MYGRSEVDLQVIQAGEVMSAKETAAKVQLVKWLMVVQVSFKPESRNIPEAAMNTVCAILRSLA